MSCDKSLTTDPFCARSICIQRFSSGKMLQRHLRVHMKNDENFYGCKVCALSFVCYEALLSHLRGENHKRMKIRIQGVFVCVDCRRVFPSRDSYAMHMLLRAQSEVCGDSMTHTRDGLTDMRDGDGLTDMRGGDGLTDMRGDDGLTDMRGGDGLADIRGGDSLTDLRGDGLTDTHSGDKDGSVSHDGGNSIASGESIQGGGGDSFRNGPSPTGTPTEPAPLESRDPGQHPLNLSTNGGSEGRSESIVAQAQTTAENGHTEKASESPDGATDPVSPGEEKSDEEAAECSREDGADSAEWQRKDGVTLSECLRNDAESSTELLPQARSRGKKPRGISSSHFRTMAAATLKRNYGPWANRTRVVRRGSGGNTPMTCVVCWALLESCDSLAMHMMEQHSQPKSSFFGTPAVQPPPPPTQQRSAEDAVDEAIPPLLLTHVQYQTYAMETDGGQCEYTSGSRGQDSSVGKVTNTTSASPECGIVLPDSTKRKTSLGGVSDDSDPKQRRLSLPGKATDGLGQCRQEVGSGKATELCTHCGVAFCEHTAWELLTKNGTFRPPARHASPARIPTIICDAVDVSRRNQAATSGGDTPGRHAGDAVCGFVPRRPPSCENEAALADGYRKDVAADATSNKTLSPQLPEPSHMRVSEDGSSDRSTPGALATAPTSPRRSTTATTTATLQHDELGEGDVIDYVLSNVDRLAMCKYCRIVFTDRTIYYLHMGLHNLNNPWQCNLCGRACSNVHEFSSHVIHY